MAVVTVVPSGEQIFCPPGTTLLAALFAAGYSYTIGCRRGGCGICKVAVHQGAVTHNRTVAETVLTADEAREGACLSCRAVPEGDVTIELHEGCLRLVNPLLRSLNEKARDRAASVDQSPASSTPGGAQESGE